MGSKDTFSLSIDFNTLFFRNKVPWGGSRWAWLRHSMAKWSLERGAGRNSRKWFQNKSTRLLKSHFTPIVSCWRNGDYYKQGEFSDHNENGQDPYWAQKMDVIKGCIISLCLKLTTLLGDLNYTAILHCGHLSRLSSLLFQISCSSLFLLYLTTNISFPQVFKETDTLGLGSSLTSTRNKMKYFYCVLCE